MALGTIPDLDFVLVAVALVLFSVRAQPSSIFLTVSLLKSQLSGAASSSKFVEAISIQHSNPISWHTANISAQVDLPTSITDRQHKAESQGILPLPEDPKAILEEQLGFRTKGLRITTHINPVYAYILFSSDPLYLTMQTCMLLLRGRKSMNPTSLTLHSG